jgi:hypothetical protein
LLATARAMDDLYGKHLLLYSVPTGLDTGRWKDKLLPSAVLCMLDRIIHGYLIQPTSMIYSKTGISKLEGRAYFSPLIASAIWR